MIPVLKEKDAKNSALAKAGQNGHDMGPWRRNRSAHFFIKSKCKKCSQTMEVISQYVADDKLDGVRDNAYCFGRFEGRDASLSNFTYATGAALGFRCRA